MQITIEGAFPLAYSVDKKESTREAYDGLWLLGFSRFLLIPSDQRLLFRIALHPVYLNPSDERLC